MRAFHLLAILLVTATLGAAPLKEWKAEWIWDSGEPAPKNRYLQFQKKFQLQQRPATATLHISADDFYRLSVNGSFVGRGPARSDPRWQQYDSHDVAGKLRPGENVIDVVVHHVGIESGFTVLTRGGLICQLELPNDTIGSDGAWKVARASEWLQEVPLTWPRLLYLGFPEIYNRTQSSRDWKQATIIPAQDRPWASLIPREIPLLREEEVFPDKVVRIGQVLDLESLHPRELLIAERMSREILQEPIDVEISTPANLLRRDGHYSVIRNNRFDYEAEDFDGIKEASIVLDFGRVLNGHIRLDWKGHRGQMVDISWSQWLVAGQVPPVLRSLRNASRVISGDGVQSWEMFAYKNFRFVQLTFRNLYLPLELDSVSATELTHPAEVIGSFECSDPLLTWLWRACVRTTQLCMTDAYVDNAYREQSQWYGDISAVILSTAAAMGDIPLLRKYLRDFRRGQLPSGIARSSWPARDWGIWSHHALLAVWYLRDYYQMYGEPEFAEQMYPVVTGIARWYGEHANEDGLVTGLENNWLDWSNTDLRGVPFVTNALYLANLQNAAYFAGLLGHAGEQRSWQQKAGNIQAMLTERYWSEERGAYFDALVDGKPTGRFSEHSNAFALLLDLAPGERTARIQQALLEGRPAMAPTSPTLFYFLQLALARTGRVSEMLDLTRKRFRQMYRSGSDSVWEEWSYNASLTPIRNNRPPLATGRLPQDYWTPKDRSVAQGGAVASSHLLSTEILGIQPAEPGFQQVRIAPQPGGLKWARGKFPTSQGLISVEWTNEPNEFRLRYSVPGGTGVELVLPFEKGQLEKLEVDAETLRSPVTELRLRKPSATVVATLKQ